MSQKQIEKDFYVKQELKEKQHDFDPNRDSDQREFLKSHLEKKRRQTNQNMRKVYMQIICLKPNIKTTCFE